MKKNAAGLLLALAIAAVSWQFFKPMQAIAAMFIGMAAGTTIKMPPVLGPGIAFASKKILQLSVILLGFEMNLRQVFLTGAESVYVMAFTLLAAFLAAWMAGRVLGVERNTNILIGVGTAICGGSAIAATAPVIDADDDEIAHSISTIFLFNVAAVFLFPLLGHSLGMDQQAFGVFAGTAINDTSSVVAAAASYGDAALETATVVKLTRTLVIVPIALVLSVVVRKGGAQEGAPVSVAKIFPFFVLGFLAASALCTAFPAYAPFFKSLSTAGKFCIAAAMAAIGLKTNLIALVRNGVRPILLGMCCWAAVTVAAIIVEYAQGYTITGL